MADHGWRVRAEIVIHDRDDHRDKVPILLVQGPQGWALPGGFVENTSVRAALDEHVREQTGLDFSGDLQEVVPVGVFEVDTGYGWVLVFQLEAVAEAAKAARGRWFDLGDDLPSPTDPWSQATLPRSSWVVPHDGLPNEVGWPLDQIPHGGAPTEPHDNTPPSQIHDSEAQGKGHDSR
ncbi:NUDIX domain-containing protein [Sciscionella marina]|uniref:NUDIX domain-containing protein n=1 Tax=Sciscionella marina TaxID=508770 RepID=UPI0003822096|nr:NUDIX hydrolase [Sciscionella marina]